MKSTTALLLLGGVGVAYFMWKRNQSAQPDIPGSRPSAYSPSQPSQVYPWTPTVPPRVDNANQPWYNGTRIPTQNGTAVQQAAMDLQAGASILHSLTDIWGSFSDLWGSDPAGDLDTDWLDDGTETALVDSWEMEAGDYFDWEENNYDVGTAYA